METDVEALVALDHHSSLQLLSSVAVDRYEILEEAADLIEVGRASAYLELVNEHEQLRRLDQIPPSSSAHDDFDLDPMDCQVCGHQALVSTGADAFGYGVTAGVCFVCSYGRSAHIADLENLRLEWELRWKHS